MLLVLLFNSGRLCNDRIQEIVKEILIIRLDFGEEMEDVWGMIGVVLNHTSPGNSNKHVIFSPIRTAVEDVDNDVEIIQNEQVNKEMEVIDISGDIDDPSIIWERFPDYVIDINDPAINWEHYEIPLQIRAEEIHTDPMSGNSYSGIDHSPIFSAGKVY
ncbi:uncharacterized protein LOC116847010 [Odontomachus brunneus]|uniref:uncharacterized protein LOC116847010 n=1 Tax=Odontomachus brunneus TaxID=486640 RepID=UPI0013F1B54B|nr:uncharacterized protein LOC116847010 [Odontomachus brunneus]